jgi:hypothetical protein
MAPEILRSSPFYDEKVDVYSFGVLLWEMLTLMEPYQGWTQDRMVMEIIEHGARPAIPAHVGPARLLDLIKMCWAEKPIDRPSFQQITASLLMPEVHFIGTDESEFREKSPTQLLSTNIVHAFDTCNWSRLDDLLAEINPERCESDPEVLNVLMSLFPSFDSERQASVVSMLPHMVDLQHFLCMTGYSLIVSLFGYTAIVIEAAVKMLRTLPLSSKGFRQVKLITAIAHTKNSEALELCADLCEFDDIAEQVADHNIPFLGMDDFDIPILHIYERLLQHDSVRTKVSALLQPVFLAKKLMKGNERWVCSILSMIEWSTFGETRIFELDLISTVIDAIAVGENAFTVLDMILGACGSDTLEPYRHLLERVIAMLNLVVR